MPHRAIILFCLFLLSGCAANPEKLPPYAWQDAPAALHALCRRSRAVHTVQSEATLVLTRSNGESVRLDAAVVMRPPDSVRLRAWKFGQAVFDLTLTPQGVWIEGPRDAGRRDQVLPATASAAKMARAWSVLSGDFFCAADARVIDVGISQFRVERSIDGQRIVCDVERATLIPRRYSVIDPTAIERFSLSLDRYEIINGIPWPVKLTAHSDGGSMQIELKDTELNAELAPNAFVPPRKAEKVP